MILRTENLRTENKIRCRIHESGVCLTAGLRGVKVHPVFPGKHPWGRGLLGDAAVSRETSVIGQEGAVWLPGLENVEVTLLTLDNCIGPQTRCTGASFL